MTERLHLLGLELTDELPPQPEGPKTQRCRRNRRAEVLRLDAAAFSEFWAFDDRGLADAVAATPRTRFRMVTLDGSVAGYAICGRAGTRGFVQRLAVDPARQRQGLGRLLLLDGLQWMRGHGVRTTVVNTQLDNGGALALYTDVGFRPEPTGLSVLTAGV